jgi:DNA-binding transcriptional LysR family regulator
METRRLELLAELSRLGSMRAVADALGTTTSTVSQQIAVLAREMGTPLIEPAGRRVRLTPAGRRLAEHAVIILGAVEAAQLDLGPEAEPNGTVRVAGFATAIRAYLLPVLTRLTVTHPRVRVLVREHEPAEARQLLAADQADLALVYDYNLAPAVTDPAMHSTPLWTAPWGLGVPASQTAPGTTTLQTFARFRDQDWIGNSRNTADEDVIRTLAAMAGFTPRITHQADSLDLVQDMITAGLGVGLLPVGYPTHPGVRFLPLTAPGVELRASAVTRYGHLHWPPLALVTTLLQRASPPPAGLSVAARDWLGERRPPGRRLEGVGEVLGLVRDQIAGELHDAHRMGGRAVIGDDDLAHPQVTAAPDPHDGEVTLGRVPAALRLDLRPAPVALPGLRVVQDPVLSVDRVLGVAVSVLGRLPVLLDPGPGPGVAIRCLVHIGHISGRESAIRRWPRACCPRRSRPSGHCRGRTPPARVGTMQH